MMDDIQERFDRAAGVVRKTADALAEPVARAVELIVSSVRSGGTLFLFGNGGSAADAQHIAGELVGRFLLERDGIKAKALTTDTSVFTSIANDYDFQRVFARQLNAAGAAGDVAMALTTSGDSPNVLPGLTQARQMGMRTIALTGSGGGRCADLADVLLDVPCDGPTPRIQEAQVVVYHVLCEFVERELTQESE